MMPFLTDDARAQPLLLEPRQPAAMPRAELSLNAWCANHRRGASAVANDAELTRLKIVQFELAPGFDPGARSDGVALLSAYQEELEKRVPNRTSAASYLALVSAIPITLGVVERVNALLCLSSTHAFAQAVADAAEAERRQMMR